MHERFNRIWYKLHWQRWRRSILRMSLPPSPLMLDDDHIAEPRIELRLLMVPRQAADLLGEIGAKPIGADHILAVLSFALQPLDRGKREIAMPGIVVFLGK